MAYTVAQRSGLGGVEVATPIFTSTPMQKPSMYIMQQESAAKQPLLPMQTTFNGQQVWVQAVPSNGQNQVAFRPTPVFQQTQPQPQAQPITVFSNPRPVPQQQPVTLVKQAAPNPVRLVQVASNAPAVQLPQPQQQLVMAQQPQQQPDNVVLVNVNGTVQQAVVQNGSVYLLNHQFQQQQAQPQPQPQPVAGASAGQQQLVMAQQVLPAGARLVPVNQVAVSQAPVRPPALQQAVPQSQQAQQQPVMMVVMPQNGGTAMGSTMVQSSNSMMVPAAAAAALRPAQVQLPMQQLVPRGPAAAPVAARPQLQPVQVQSAAAPAFSNGTTAVLTAGQQASVQAFRPAVAAGAQLLMSGTSVSASTASLMNKGPSAAAAPGTSPGNSIVSGTIIPLSAGFSTQPQVQQMMPGAPAPNNGTAVHGSQPMLVSGAAQQRSSGGVMVMNANGELSSPPAPPITPGVNGGNPAATASTLLALLTKGGDKGSHSPSHGVIGGLRKSKDGMATAVSGASVSSAAVSSAASPSGSQPGTPARSNSGGMILPSEAISTNTSLPLAPGAAATVAALHGADNSGGSKEAVMRLVARSFIETGISLEQALGMIQPADRDLMAAAFAAEAMAGQGGAGAAAAAAGDAAISSGSGSSPPASLNNSSLFGLGGEQINMPPVSKPAGGELSLGLPGLSGLSSTDDVNDNNNSMGSWGFSLFAGNFTEPNGGTGGGRLGSLGMGQADGLMPDVAAAPTSAPAAGPKDSAMASMLAALNL